MKRRLRWVAFWFIYFRNATFHFNDLPVFAIVSRHRSDVVGCAPPSERSAGRSARPIPSCIGKRCNAAMRFDGQRRPIDDR
ncbi:hypothetical protein D8B34_25365 [Verminephrobacter eiseniae]|nr:hypothetical protein [Verminephrobacter eiseniae]MCW5296211.1 hypothetical protein [Verminephrobacter eiseniae]MCW8187669.1 hypothetical protein [Verminephrobacter eiseniae]MCW8225978.1 hypothetical protein [Verminephrobacter eiseniae]MCW8236910.1 hypothetical protein [Verminephrobacter eiseniae]